MVLTKQDWGGGSGRASSARSSQTLLECGSVFSTAVAAMGGARSGNRMGLARCFRPAGRLDYDICKPRKYCEAYKWGTSVGQRGIADGRV